MFQFLRTMDSSADCNICGNCVKNCPNDSIKLSIRIPSKELWDLKKPRLEHASLAAVIMGIVFVQNITMLEIWQDILSAIGSVTGTLNYVVNFTIAFIFSMALPILLLLGTAKVASLMGMPGTVKRNFITFGYAIIPLDLAGHLGHNLFHFMTEGKAIWYNSMAFFRMNAEAGDFSLAPASTVQFLQYAIIVIGFIGSGYTAYRLGKMANFKSILPYYALLALLAVINIYLFSLPMNHRVH